MSTRLATRNQKDQKGSTTMHAILRSLLSRLSDQAATLCLATALLLSTLTSRATDYTWGAAAAGNWSLGTNWSPNGDPNSAADTALINATGSAYTVTVNAARSIGTLTLDSANATLNASSILTVATLADLQTGSVQGTLLMNAASSALSLERANVTIAGPTTYQFRRGVGGVAMYQTFDAGNLTANETLSIVQTDAPYNRASLNVTTANGYTNYGTISILPLGYEDGLFTGSYLSYTVTAGTLANAGTFTYNNTSAPSGKGTARVVADILNDTTGTLTINSANAQLVLGKAGATYENRGTWTVLNNGLGMYGSGTGVVGTTFTQSTAGAVLNGPTTAGKYWTLGRNLAAGQSSGADNTFSVTNGSVQGNFILHRTNLTLGAGRTVIGPTIWQIERYGAEAQNVNTTLSVDGIRANEHLIIHNDNVTGGNYRKSLNVTSANGFANYGTVTIRDNYDYHDSADYSQLTIASGSLTNYGQLTLLDTSTVAANGSRLAGQLVNESTGMVTLSASSNGQTQMGTGSNAHVNRGTIEVAAGLKNYILGATLTNEAGGVIRNAAGVTASLGTMAGTATLDNALGTIWARGGSSSSTFTVANALSAATYAGGALLAGTYTVTGGAAATALSLSAIGGAGSITQLGAASGPSATVNLDGSTAVFTQLESPVGALATINASGQLNLIGGKNFISAAILANAGTIDIDATSTLTLGAAGTGTLNNTGMLLVDGTLGSAGATVNVTGGTLTGNGTVIANLTVTGSGLLTGRVAVTGDTLIQGLHTPGDSPAIENFDGNYTLDGGTLEIELGGTIPGDEHDQLVITGDAMLDGILAVEFLPGYFPEPKKGVTYDVLTAASITIDPGFALGGTWGGLFLYELVDEGTTLRLTSNIPEPASFGLLALLALSLSNRAGRASRRRR